MRHLLLALMIVLLPLRGWMGDAMATGMATGTVAATSQHRQAATEMVAGHAHAMGSADHFEHQTASQEPVQALHDCAGHASDQSSHAADSHDNRDGHCDSCQACQACHTVALSRTAVILETAFSDPGLPHAAAAQFTSAQAALGQKPPIS